MNKTFFSMTFAALTLSSAPLMAVPCAKFADAEKALRNIWPKSYPGEKIESIAANGAASNYTKAEASGKDFIDEYGNRWEWVEKVKYCRVPGKVTVTRADGSRVLFNVSAIFRQDGKKFKFATIGVGSSEEVAGAGQEAPSKDEVKKLISALWLSQHPDHKVEKVAISAPEIKKDSSAGRWWYTTGADIHIINESGEKQKCSNDYTTVYKGEKGQEGKNPAGPWQVYFLDDPSCR